MKTNQRDESERKLQREVADEVGEQEDPAGVLDESLSKDFGVASLTSEVVMATDDETESSDRRQEIRRHHRVDVDQDSDGGAVGQTGSADFGCEAVDETKFDLKKVLT